MSFLRKKKEVGLVGKTIRVPGAMLCSILLCFALQCSGKLVLAMCRLTVSMAAALYQVGSYSVRVEALLGEGGFASVYRVQDVTTQKVQLRTSLVAQQLVHRLMISGDRR